MRFFTFIFLFFITIPLQGQSFALLSLDSETYVDSEILKDSVEIVEIKVEGQKVTKDAIILRELAIKTGDYIHRNNLATVLEKESNKIFNTDLFVKSTIEAKEIRPNKIELLIKVSEQWYIFPVPIFELSDRNLNEWWTQYNHNFSRVDYGLRLRIKNFRGRNEDLKFLIQGGFTEKIALTYRIPYLNKKKTIGSHFDFLYAENKNVPFQILNNRLNFMDSSRVLLDRVRLGGGLSLRSKFYNTHSFVISFHKNHIADRIAELNPNYFGDSRTEQRFLLLEYTFNRDFRNRAAYPTKGYYGSMRVTKKGLGFWDDLDTFSFEAHLAKFFQINPSVFFSTSLLTKFTLPKELPYTEIKAVGYRPVVARGYELSVINGSSYLLSKNTLRLKLFEGEQKIKTLKFLPNQFKTIPMQGYFKIYTDFTKVQNKQSQVNEIQDLNNRWLWTAGAGFDFVTFYSLVARFEYSINSELDRGFFFNLKSDF